jgi:prepilin-type N-terminal cleavage/methylation domain-containing protein
MERGFTMFELVITISIMVIVSSIVLVNFPGFNRQVALGRAAQEVSLALRGAQARALAVQKFTNTGEFPQGYGVYFDLANPTQYIIFADLCTACAQGEPGFGRYDPGEEVDTVDLPSRMRLMSLLTKQKTGGGPSCNELHIVYYRPDPTIQMKGFNGGCPADGILGDGDVEIVIGALESAEARQVVAWTTGQVSVETP